MLMVAHLARSDSALAMQPGSLVYLWRRTHLYIAGCWVAYKTLIALFCVQENKGSLGACCGLGWEESSGGLLYFDVKK